MTLFENNIVYVKIILFTFILNSVFLITPLKLLRGYHRGVDQKKVLCAADMVLEATGLRGGELVSLVQRSWRTRGFGEVRNAGVLRAGIWRKGALDCVFLREFELSGVGL